jgi:hypothetical protein
MAVRIPQFFFSFVISEVEKSPKEMDMEGNRRREGPSLRKGEKR